MKKRLFWIDTIRGFAIFAVVIQHALQRTLTGLNPNDLTIMHINDFIYCFNMPLFFCISGFLWGGDREKVKTKSDLKTYLINKSWGLLAPYIIFAIAIWCGKRLFSQFVTNTVSFMDLIGMFLNPIAFLWFIYVLFVISSIIAIVDFWVKSPKKVLILTIIWAVISISYSFDIKILDRTLYYSVFYYLGAFLYNKKVDLKKYIFAGIAFVIMSIYHFYAQDSSLITIAAQLLGAFSLFGLIEFIPYANKRNVFSDLGIKSIYIYVLHPIVINVVKVGLTKVHLANSVVWIVCMVVFGTILPLIYERMASKVFIFDFPFKPKKYLIRQK